MSLNRCWLSFYKISAAFNINTNGVYYYDYFTYPLVCIGLQPLFYFIHSSLSVLLFVWRVFIRFPSWQLVFLSKAKVERWHSVPHLFIAWLSTL